MAATTDPSDQILIKKVLEGDIQSFEVLILRYQGVVHRFLLHYLGNAADAEELTQETFISIYSKLSQHNSAQSFFGRTMTIARDLAISHHRRHPATPLDSSVLAAAVKDVSPALENDLIMKEAGNEVHQALQALGETSREILIMHYILDLPLEKVSELLNIPEQTAKSRLFKARNEIKALLINNCNKFRSSTGHKSL